MPPRKSKVSLFDERKLNQEKTAWEKGKTFLSNLKKAKMLCAATSFPHSGIQTEGIPENFPNQGYNKDGFVAYRSTKMKSLLT